MAKSLCLHCVNGEGNRKLPLISFFYFHSTDCLTTRTLRIDARWWMGSCYPESDTYARQSSLLELRQGFDCS